MDGTRVLAALEAFAPQRYALEGDRIGLQVGRLDKPVRRVLTTLDTTIEVVEEAAAFGADLIVSHHAVIFRPLADLRTDRPRGRILEALLRHDIAVYVPHTAMDVAPGGLNDHLAERLGLTGLELLRATGRDHQVGDGGDGGDGGYGIGRVGQLPSPLTLEDFAGRVLAALEAPFLRRVGRSERLIERVAVLCGDGNRFVEDALAKKADVLVTGDVYYHTALEARARGLALLDPGHNATERWGGRLWCEVLSAALGDADIDLRPSASVTEPFEIELRML